MANLQWLTHKDKKVLSLDFRRVYAGPRLISLTKTQVDKTQPPALIDHNLYYCAAGTKASAWVGASGTITGFNNYVKSTGNDQHARALDPHFIDPVTKDCYLQPGSSALGAGTIDKLPFGDVDLEGSPRLSFGKIDLGCYQKP